MPIKKEMNYQKKDSKKEIFLFPNELIAIMIFYHNSRAFMTLPKRMMMMLIEID